MEAPGVPTGSVRGRKGKEGRQGGGWGGEAKILVGVRGR